MTDASRDAFVAVPVESLLRAGLNLFTFESCPEEPIRADRTLARIDNGQGLLQVTSQSIVTILLMTVVSSWHTFKQFMIVVVQFRILALAFQRSVVVNLTLGAGRHVDATAA